MVYDSETYELCHELNEKYRDSYRAVLERAADDIIWRHEHPIKAFLRRLREIFIRPE